MKKTMLSLAIAIGLFAASCGNEKKEEGAHQHEDGTTHADHIATSADTTKQEEFKVDSAAADTTAHSHADGKPHKH